MARFLRLIALLAVLVMPFGMTSAVAASPQHTASMPMQHCPEQGSKHESRTAFAECTMACSVALPVSDDAQEQLLAVDRAANHATVAQILRGLHPETATPPPKMS
jgi:hypothetical protein